MGQPRDSILDVPGAGNELRILLRLAFESEEIPVATVVFAGEFAAGQRAGFVDGAAAVGGIKELADFAEVLVGLAAHHPPVALNCLEIFLLGLRERQAKMFGDAGGIAVFHFNDRIRTAIAWAFQAIIFELLGPGFGKCGFGRCGCCFLYGRRRRHGASQCRNGLAG